MLTFCDFVGNLTVGIKTHRRLFAAKDGFAEQFAVDMDN
jgi:hypothetical protein